MNEIDMKIHADIERVGWSVISVFAPDPRSVNFPFAYTIGLSLLDLPELIVTGKNPINAMRLLNAVGKLAKQRGAKFNAFDVVKAEDVPRPKAEPLNLIRPDFPVTFLEMTKEKSEVYLKNRLPSFDGEYSPAQQVVYSDEDESFPWEIAGYSWLLDQRILGELD